jgi:hypothetical protein
MDRGRLEDVDNNNAAFIYTMLSPANMIHIKCLNTHRHTQLSQLISEYIPTILLYELNLFVRFQSPFFLRKWERERDDDLIRYIFQV